MNITAIQISEKRQKVKTKLKTKRNEKAPSGALIPLNLKNIRLWNIQR